MRKSGKSGESRESDKQIHEAKSAGFSSVLLRQSDAGRVWRFQSTTQDLEISIT